MTEMTSGLRTRLLRDSLFSLVADGLTAIGWFDTGRRHQPVRLYHEPAEWNEPVEPNAVAITVDAVTTEYVETGSNLARYTHDIVVDLFAEGEALGVELANDIREILRGRLGGLSSVPIYDFRASATPPVLAHASVANVEVTRSLVASAQPWQRYWFVITCQATDTYLLPA